MKKARARSREHAPYSPAWGSHHFPSPPIPNSLVCISQGSLENRINRRGNRKRKERGGGVWEKEGEKERNLSRKFGRADVMVQKPLAMKIPMTVQYLLCSGLQLAG